MSRRRLAAVVLGASLAVLLGLGFAEDPSFQQQREQAQKLLGDGNYKDAYDIFRKLALDPNTDPLRVPDDLNQGLQALQNLGDLEKVDEFREASIEAHAGNWRLLQAAAESYLNIEHHGYMVAGQFERGHKRGGGQFVHAYERDRVRALQLMVQALPLVAQEDDKRAAGEFYLTLARHVLSNRGYEEAWRLQYLTDLAVLPDYEEGWYYGRGNVGAPVDAEGNPIYHYVPKSWEEAATDGERWRWCLMQAMEVSPALTNTVRWQLADFCLNQFGVQTLAYYGYWFGGPDHDEGQQEDTGTWQLHTLAEDETIARLATGAKRFKLPDEFNYIRIWQQIADEAKDPAGGDFAAQSLESLAQEFENRRQYPKAADYWRRAIEKYGPGQENYRQKRLDQIVGNWGRFEGVGVQPAGRGATVEFRFRNGREVHFEARAILIEQLLADVKAYLKSNPGQLDWQQMNIQDLGWRFIQEGQQKYLADKVAASWALPLEPREKHFDRRITVTTPLQKAGAYLVTARMENGNASHILMWLEDTVIVKKPMQGQTWYFVTDATTGKPLAEANVEFFGYRQVHVGGNQFRVETRNFAEFTDKDGQVLLPIENEGEQFTWIVIARSDDQQKRFAFLGFTNMWNAQYYDYEYKETKVFTITDRPVYRPKQMVKFKFWVRHAQYDQEDVSDFANQPFTVQINDPQGNKVFEKQFTSDAYAGLDGEYELPDGAPLGVYSLLIVNLGGSKFRVEEYKKPEYEVTIEAPTEPVMLGEKITATIQAKYYFGAPVTEAKVKYKVLRSGYSQHWYPPMPWDWFYGPGYWWFAYDYPWYKGWNEWGCTRPIPWWWGGWQQPPEVVADAEVQIGADGTVPIELDTALAKEIHGDQDHQYSITAEVVDASRRTIVGTGNVLVARQPFKVFVWVDRGYYRVGGTIRASTSAHTLDQKAVKGKGKLTLYQISYDDKQQPVETEVETWDLDTDDQGQAAQQLVAAEPGQYRLSYVLTDAKEHTIEGGYLFTVMGRGYRSASYRFNAIELIPDQDEYAPGEEVKLQVNVNQVGGTVALFVRPANGVYLAPQIIRLRGKSTVVEIAVSKKDMPNFFIEAITVADGQLHTETKEIVVPPEKRVLNVALEPTSDTYKPGDQAEVKLTLTDFGGKPFVGSTVLAVYDKAVEYISGGSNVPEIKEFFWKWRRRHDAQTEHNLARWFYNLVRPNEPAMADLGVFGGTVADDDKAWYAAEAEGGRGGAFGDVTRLGARMDRDGAEKAAAAPQAAMNALGDAIGGGGAAPGQPALVEPTVRTEFADTAHWSAAITTDGDGVATVTVKMPESLTTWKVKAWGMGHGTKVGQGDVEVITKKDLLVRLQAPRFFVEKDQVVLSANVHNYLPGAKSVQVELELEGGVLQPMGQTQQTVQIEAGGQARVDWRVQVVGEGQATVRMKALSDEESDAMQLSFPAYVHGMLKQEAFSGALRPADESGQVRFRVPQERRIDDSRLEVRFSPTLAGALVDALPYLADYPYGCTEQTLNRFLPTVITQKVLIDMGLDLKAIQQKRANLNAQELGDPAQRAAQWKQFERNPVFDQQEVTRMVKEGVRKLTEMQLADGGWGWFSGWGEQSWPHTTALVVHGLQVAAANDVALVPGVLDRGLAWLKTYQDEQLRLLRNAATKTQPYKLYADNLDALVFMVLVDAGIADNEMRDFLYRDRTKLAVYSKAMYGLALHKLGDQEKLSMILRNIQQFLETDDENQTAWLDLPEDNYWWSWYGSDVEAMSYYLKLLARTDPQGETAPRLVKYLLNNRKHATYWNSTRDTAVAIEALAEYLRASGEDKPDMTVEVWLDGQQQKAVEVTAENLFTIDNTFVLLGDAVQTGEHKLELRKRGKGPLYFNAYLTTFTLEDHIERAGLEIKVLRRFYRLKKVDKTVKVSGSRGQAVDQKVEKYQREEIENLGVLKSGELVEIELEIDSKNDYEYLVFEDLKAAGFEPVEVRSGYNGNALGAYVEFRDNRVAFFVRWLARGEHSVAYRLRAEIPGQFSALPARGFAMYAPELAANSDELKVAIED